MRSIYVPGSPITLDIILADWLKERALPVEIMWREDPRGGGSWYLVGETWLTAEIDGPRIIGWQPGFDLHAANPDFFKKLENEILHAESGDEPMNGKR